MKKQFLLLFNENNEVKNKKALESLKADNIAVLAQYGNSALEIFATDEEVRNLPDRSLYKVVTDKALSQEATQRIEDDIRPIIEAWNERAGSGESSGSRGQSGPEKSNRGLSWGAEGFDEPRPHTDISGTFFQTAIRKTRLDSITDLKVRTRGARNVRSADHYQKIYNRISERFADPTKAYHLSRLALNHPELEDEIMNLSESDLIKLFETSRSERSNFGVNPAELLGQGGQSRGPSNAGPEAPCWRLDGEISVGVVFVESSLTGGPTFTTTEKNTLLSEVQTGLNWLASQHPHGGVTWVYSLHYIKIAVNNGTNDSTEDYWRNAAMKKLSYNGKSFSGDWNGVVAYREAMRVANQSAHAIVVFITPYGTEWHAYASNGRLTLARRSNWGNWGINTIDAITAHEVCHLFGAADEYTGSGTPCNSCTTIHGCLGMPNGNCKACASSPVPCVMDANNLSICGYTRGQLGWSQVWDWQEIDAGAGNKTIVAAGSSVYKLKTNGEIWKYSGTGSNWQKIDQNPATVAIAAAGNNIYQLHNTGKIWKYTGVPITGWQLIDQNPATKAIVASGNDIFQLHNTGRIWKYTGVPISGWQLIDQNPATVSIIAAGGNVYQMHNNGKVWKYTGVPISGWQLISDSTATKSIVAAGTKLYQLRNNGVIQLYKGTPNNWQTVDNNPATTAILASGNRLLQMHNNGRIWQYLGTPVTGWQLLDFNPKSKVLACSDSTLYQMHNDGRVWRFKGSLV